MDTTVMEYTAEDLIAHKLQRAGILVAKPKFDREGADLLAFLAVSDGAKFCRIQCKGRSLMNSKRSQVDISRKYVSDGFVLFLFVETGQREETHLFCFTAEDIRAKWSIHDDHYELAVSEIKMGSELAGFSFNDQKVQQIKGIIERTNVKQEFQQMIHGRLDVALEPVTLVATGTVTDSPKQP